MRDEKKTIFLVGDFNAHICDTEGGVLGCSTPTNRNGRKLLNFARMSGMTIGNMQSWCEGKWTRMREGNVPSILDYVLMDEDHSHQIQKMLIDDDGAGLAGRQVGQTGVQRSAK